MVGVAAIALDQGFRVVVVLAGLKDDLRRQTATRFNSQLLRQNDPIEGAAGQSTLGGPLGPGPLGGFSLNYFFDSNHVPTLQVQMERALRNDEPCVLVVKKHPASLIAISNVLRTILRRTPVEALPILILDDECDEASVAAPGEDRTIPLSIANIWQSISPRPRVAYVGYTATAAAALLQDPTNDLFPSHFVQLLRYPAAQDSPLTYRLAEGDMWYTGGATYYQDFGDEPGETTNFLVVPEVSDNDLHSDPNDNESLYEALIAFFVSGAMRLVLQPDKSLDDPDHLPAPHSMMVQTSTSVDEHALWRDAIKDLLGGEAMGEGTVLFDERILMDRFSREEPRWRGWYDKFMASRERIYHDRPHSQTQAPIAWEAVVNNLPSVFRHTNLKAVNSDGVEGQTLDYTAKISPSGTLVRPQDVYVIAVGGSKLSRGLTIEGLGISYYTRSSNRPLEDSTLQMSRWFGYRGPHLEFCRLFTTLQTYERLKDIQGNDYDHRIRLAELAAQRAQVEQARLALRTSPTGLLTAKLGVGTIHDLAFSPFTHVYSHLETASFAEYNEDVALQIVSKIRERAGRPVIGVSGDPRGLISRGWTAVEVASVLDSLSYTGHNPDPTRYPMPELYRAADPQREPGKLLETNNDPYVAAAYLRYWDSLPQSAPVFNVGVTFGSLAQETAPFDFSLLNRKISQTGRMEGGWSGASASWRGDALFDSPPDNLVSMNGLRLNGAEGLLLMHIVHKAARGRSGDGVVREFHSPTFGLAVPGGGPAFSVVVNYAL